MQMSFSTPALLLQRGCCLTLEMYRICSVSSCFLMLCFPTQAPYELGLLFMC